MLSVPGKTIEILLNKPIFQVFFFHDYQPILCENPQDEKRSNVSCCKKRRLEWLEGDYSVKMRFCTAELDRTEDRLNKLVGSHVAKILQNQELAYYEDHN